MHVLFFSYVGSTLPWFIVKIELLIFNKVVIHVALQLYKILQLHLGARNEFQLLVCGHEQA